MNIRKGFRVTANQLAEFLPPTAETRKPIDLSVTSPWEDHDGIDIKPADNSVKKACASNDALRTATLSNIKEENADITIYTAGSAEAGLWNGGSAAVVTTGEPENPEVLNTLRAKGSSITCSTEEEVEGMKLARTWIAENAPANAKVLICTDSNAICQALANPDVGEYATLRRDLDSLEQEVCVRWVPSHVNVPGNELADQAAKLATQLEAPPRGVSFNAAKQLVRRNIIDQPADPIKFELSREVYDNYKLRNDDTLQTRSEQTLVAKIRTGKWRKFRAYQHKLNEAIDPHCKFCPGKIHDLKHWMTDCTATDGLRQRLFGTLTPGLQVLASEPVKLVQMASKSNF